MKTGLRSLLAAICVSQAGCIGLSRQHAVHQWGIHAQLVDEADSRPISRREMVVSMDGQYSKQRTDHNGNLRTHSETIPFWTWLGGPWVASDPAAGISISTVGYQPHSLTWDKQDPADSRNIQVVHPFVGRPYLDLGVVKLHKRLPAPGSAESAAP